MYISEMIAALEKPENLPNCQHELTKASEKLSKVLNEADIRLLMENMSQKNRAEVYVFTVCCHQANFNDF